MCVCKRAESVIFYFSSRFNCLLTIALKALIIIIIMANRFTSQIYKKLQKKLVDIHEISLLSNISVVTTPCL